MINFFSKKLNKKGFTLAELLIVVAIIAILIAVAIPIYTGAMKEAQRKVNMSNARALRGAATSEILMHWNDADDTTKLATGADGNGWIAWAAFDANGNISQIKVRVAKGTGEKLSATATSHVASYAGTGPITGATVVAEPTISSVVAVDDKDKSGSVTNPNTIVIYLNSTEVKHS